MNIQNTIVREYLESLTESEELDYIFPILLEAKNFTILTTPKEYKGFPQYGKDIVAVGNDDVDGINKRFYFEIKGGEDRDITTTTYKKGDGIRESIIEAKDKNFTTTFPKFEELPLKIVLVHNGILKPNVAETFHGFINREFPYGGTIQFDRWGIERLVPLFTEYLFGAHLLTNKENTRLFNRVLINFESYEGISPDFIELVNKILYATQAKRISKKLSRSWKVTFETLKLLSLIVYTESKSYKNLEIAKRYLSQIVLMFWHWVLKSRLERHHEVQRYFNQIVYFFFNALKEYFQRVLPIATIKNGIASEEAGRYEQIGYTMRSFDVLQYFLLFQKMCLVYDENLNLTSFRDTMVELVNANGVMARPLIDIHSIPIVDTLLFFIEVDDKKSARNYLKKVFTYLRWGKDSYDRLPDANNNVKSVIKLIATQQKSVYYSDSTSPLLTVLFEFLIILDCREEYQPYRDFVLKHKTNLGLFVPHHGKASKSFDLREDKENDLEEQLFSKSVYDGYQSELRLINHDLEKGILNHPIGFDDLKQKLLARRDEFAYDYRTDAMGFSFLKDLAHIFYKTPYFPDRWRAFL